MTKDKYHHGTLREDLIEKGLQLLNKEGYEGLSLRKVASMCGVSHTAPYKHFQNKDELVSAIISEVSGSFYSYLENIQNKFSNEPEIQVFEIGKGYVKFFIDNPDYLRFMFLTDHSCPIQMDKLTAGYSDMGSFEIFKQCACNYLNHINAKPEDFALNILTMWSIVHGAAVLIVNNCVSFDEDYINLVERMLREKLNFSDK